MGSIGPTRGRCLSKLREALERMQQVVNASLAHLLERLDALIVGPVRESLDTRRLVVTPPGVLAGMPRSLLPTLAVRALTLPLSATRFLAQRAQPLSLRSAGLAAGPGAPAPKRT